MTKFLIERTFHVSEDQMDYVGRRSKQVAQDDYPDITWHHSHVVVSDDGKVRTYCVYEAPTREIVEGHAEALGMRRNLRDRRGRHPRRLPALDGLLVAPAREQDFVHVEHRLRRDGLPSRHLTP